MCCEAPDNTNTDTNIDANTDTTTYIQIQIQIQPLPPLFPFEAPADAPGTALSDRGEVQRSGETWIGRTGEAANVQNIVFFQKLFHFLSLLGMFFSTRLRHLLRYFF